MIPVEWAPLLLQRDDAVEGLVPVQHSAPVPNDVGWMEIASYIALAAAVFTLGFMRIIRHHIDERHLPPLSDLVARLLLCLVCAGGGAIVGWRIWDVWLGGVLGTVGSGGHVVILHAFVRLISLFTSLRVEKSD